MLLKSASKLDHIWSVVRDDKRYERSLARVSTEVGKLIQDPSKGWLKVFVELGEGEVWGFGLVVVGSEKLIRWQRVFVEEEWVSRKFRMDDDRVELLYLYVVEKQRRKGVGTRLLAEIWSWCRKKRYGLMYAMVSEVGDRAIRFYLDRGGRVLYKFEVDDDSQVPVETAFMVWKLD